jgi:zinc D-Ala-D-Ala carboxypeptidase
MTERVSPHFSMREVCATGTGIHNVPDAAQSAQLVQFFNTIMEPIRARFGPIRVNSGFRSAKVNKAIGGARDSAHLYGCACDFRPLTPGVGWAEVMNWIVASDLPYDQVIYERRGTSTWIHIGGLRPNHEPKPRRQALSIVNWACRKWQGVAA